MMRSTRRSEGKAALGLLAVLVVLLGGGGVNYARNLESEQASEKTRPFHNYEHDDLSQLRAAYAQEVESFEARYQRERATRQRVDGRGMMDERVADFERIQDRSSQIRELSTEVAEREARLREIDEEITYRSTLGQGWERHLRRLTRI